MNDFTDEKQEKVLGKVRKLLERADHPATPIAEAESARAMAESLMLKYRLDEAMAVMSGDTSVTPVWRELDLIVADSEFASFYYQLAGVVMNHVSARGRTAWRLDEETGKYWTRLEWVGYSSDLNYGELLLTAAMMEFGKRLEPKYDPSLSDRDNIYNMRSAGMERKRIAMLVYGSWTTENEMKAKNRKVTAEFKKACAERDEDADVLLGRGNNVKTYRRSYAEGFVSTFWSRLNRMRTAQGEESSGLVLRDRSERVQEAFYTKFPQYRPKPVNPDAPAPKAVRVRARKVKEQPFNSAAYSRGGAAAALVDLGPNATGTSKVNGADRKSIG